MSSGSWTNNDGLYLQFGTSKATAETFGDYQVAGQTRMVEGVINLANLTTSNATTIVSNTLFFPQGQNLFIEKVELIAEQPMSTTGAPTFTVGLIQDDRATVGTGGGATAFVAAITSNSLSATGTIVSLSAGSASAGSYIGDYNTQWNTNTSGTNSVGGYITATLGTTTATGLIRIRVFYHGVGTITQ
jgi:hypothetical protein